MITDMWPMLFVQSYGHTKIGHTGNAWWLVGQSFGCLVDWKEKGWVARNERTLGEGFGDGWLLFVGTDDEGGGGGGQGMQTVIR